MSKQTEDGHGPETCYGGVCRSESDVECPFFSPIDPSPADTGRFPEHLDLPKKHEHHYTVPVEWSERMAPDATGAELKRLGMYFVTTLRCETCPSEIAR